MKRHFVCLLLTAAFAISGCAPMGTDVSLQIRSAPPPPAFEFSSEPRFNYMSNHRVGVIADDGFSYDMFNSGGYYYLYSGGYWYRAQSARGRFQVIETRRVPRAIFQVSDQQYRWRNHPQGWRGQGNNPRDEHRGQDNGSNPH